MGCCVSQSSQTVADRGINAMIAEEMEREKRTIRVLLLGANDSGKTALVNKMRKIYTKVTEDERLAFATPIAEAIIESLRTLSRMSKHWEQLRPECKVSSPKLDALAEELRSPMCVLELAPDCVEQFTALWEDEGIQRTFEYRNEFSLMEDVAYFMGRMKEIAEPRYVPTWNDYIRFRVRTHGCLEESFPINSFGGDITLKLTDFSCNRKRELKMCTRLFQDTNIHGILYVVAADGYDTVLFEDATHNQWRDSLQLFGELAERHVFDNRTVVMFFNKYDLFSEKIEKVPVTVEFSEEFEADDTVTDPNDAIQVLQFLFHMFQKSFKDKVPLERRSAIHWHATSWLNANLVQLLLNNIVGDLVNQRLVDVESTCCCC